MQQTHNLRKPAVSGVFYPAEAGELSSLVRRLLAKAEDKIIRRRPQAIVVPHAGYAYSGPVAASGFVQVRGAADTVRRVVILGPSHHCAFRGMALPEADVFRTPLGEVPVDVESCQQLVASGHAYVDPTAHQHEHCIEVELPFLQGILARFTIVPVVTGQARPDEVAALIEQLWGGPETMVVISTDLSHYFDYMQARHFDRLTREAIETLNESSLSSERACGHVALAGLLYFARAHRLRVETLDLRNSGDIAGDRRQVVGYGAWGFYAGD